MHNSIRNQYKYNIGETINNKIILKQIRMSNGLGKSCKGYLVRCICDNYEWEITEYNIVKRGCPVCSNKIVITGINDITTTHPKLIHYFKYLKDAQTNTYSCTTRVNMICPQCGFEKIRKIDGLAREGFNCPKCGDGSSVPEKFMLCVLEQFKIKFKWQKTFKWCENKRYDFYFKINNIEYVIETNGAQHYEESNNNYLRNLEEEQKNDKYKKELAIYNGIKEENYIIIDCRRTEYKYMQNSIANSRLNGLFDLSIINWNKCKEYALSSRVKEACNYWNNGIKSTTKIGKIMKMSSNTICTYLKIGKELLWCDYIPYKIGNQTKKILFIEEERIFESVAVLTEYLSSKYSDDFHDFMIRYVCLNKQKSYKGFHFKYV